VASLFILDIAEYEPMWKNAIGDSTLEVRHVGPYVELEFPDAVTIPRVAAGVRHAVWYSGVGAVIGARVVQFDKEALRVVAIDAMEETDDDEP
jgi:hypothetical protein